MSAVYLDYAATTPVDERVAAAMAACLTQAGTFGNPGSLSHDFGDAASAAVEAARGQVAAAVGASMADIVWTSGATEADNLAIFGIANYHRNTGQHLITVRTEHKAVLDPCRELERRGWRVTYLVPGRGGVLDPAQVKEALQPDTVLVSVMHVNNEIGVVQDIAAIAAICAAHGKARLHVDAAQSVGKWPLDFDALGLDLMSLSAHKAYGPKGVGALVVSRKRGVHLQALQFGGGQERNLRSGTVPTHQVVGMGVAFALAAALRYEEERRIRRLRDRLWLGIEALGGVLRNGDAARSVAHLLNVSFEGVEGESLLAAVRSSIAVSTGSACTSAVQEPSYVLRALGRDERLAESSLRFSLGRYSTEAEVDTAVAAVTSAVEYLRRVAGVGGAPRAASATVATAAVPAAYSELTWRHFRAAGRAGELTGTDACRGSAGTYAQGTWVQFDVRIVGTAASGDARCQSEGGQEARCQGARGQVAAAAFLAFGCPHVIAVCDWLAQQAVGRPAAACLPESVTALQRRFGVPTEKLGRLLIVEDAWIAALSPPSPG